MKNAPHNSISIIVPNYNNGHYLSAFISSVINSTVEPWELIIVDDGSQDDSLEVLKAYEHLPYLRVIKFEKNKGLTAALNAALDASTGKYVMRADPDDRLSKYRMESQLDFMKNNPETDVVGCNVVYFDDQTGKKINSSNFPLTHHKIASAFRRGEHGLQHPTAFYKGDVYRKYRYQKLFPGEDYEIFSRMIRDGHRFANLHEPYYYMRVHDGSATSNLKRKHIRTTFRFRDEIFGTKSSAFRIEFYYRYMLHYRKYQLAKKPFQKAYYLALSAVFYPSRVLNRMFRI